MHWTENKTAALKLYGIGSVWWNGNINTRERSTTSMESHKTCSEYLWWRNIMLFFSVKQYKTESLKFLRKSSMTLVFDIYWIWRKGLIIKQRTMYFKTSLDGDLFIALTLATTWIKFADTDVNVRGKSIRMSKCTPHLTCLILHLLDVLLVISQYHGYYPC